MQAELSALVVPGHFQHPIEHVGGVESLRGGMVERAGSVEGGLDDGAQGRGQLLQGLRGGLRHQTRQGHAQQLVAGVAGVGQHGVV